MPVRREGYERQIHSVEHQLNGHEDGDYVAFDQKSGDAAGKQDSAEYQVI
jgi:hypothetical protein